MVCVIWDLDGTLVDSSADLAAAVNHARSVYGLGPLPLAEVRRAVGDGMDLLLERTHHELGADWPRARTPFRDYYAAHCTVATACFPGIDKVVAAFTEAGWAQGVVTNKPRDFTLRILDHAGLAGAMVRVVGGDEGRRKPAADGLLAVLAAAGADAAASWMIGDHHTDIRAGRAAGCRVCWTAWGIGQRGDHEVDLVALEPADLHDILDPHFVTSGCT